MRLLPAIGILACAESNAQEMMVVVKHTCHYVSENQSEKTLFIGQRWVMAHLNLPKNNNGESEAFKVAMYKCFTSKYAPFYQYFEALFYF